MASLVPSCGSSSSSASPAQQVGISIASPSSSCSSKRCGAIVVDSSVVAVSKGSSNESGTRSLLVASPSAEASSKEDESLMLRTWNSMSERNGEGLVPSITSATATELLDYYPRGSGDKGTGLENEEEVDAAVYDEDDTVVDEQQNNDEEAENNNQNTSSTDVNVDDRPAPCVSNLRKRGYPLFVELFKLPSCQACVQEVREFLASVPYPPMRREQVAAQVHLFLSQAQTKLLQVEPFAKLSEDQQLVACEGLEKFVLMRLHARVFLCEETDEADNSKLYEHLRRLDWVECRHLEMAELPEEGVDLAISELSKMSAYKSPRDKLVCAMNTCMVINNVLAERSSDSTDSLSFPIPASSTPGADEFLPALIYVILKAKPTDLHANLEYIGAFRHPSRLIGSDQYYFTHLWSAVQFIKNIGKTSQLSITDSEFLEKFYGPTGGPTAEEAAEIAMAGPPAPTVEAILAVLGMIDKFGTGQFESVTTVGKLTVEELTKFFEEYKTVVAILGKTRPILDFLRHTQSKGVSVILPFGAKAKANKGDSGSSDKAGGGVTSLFWRT